MKFKSLLDIWRDRRSQKTTFLGLLLVILAVFRVPSSEPELTALLVAMLDLPPEYAGAAPDIGVGLIGVAFVFLDGKKLPFGKSQNALKSPLFSAVLALCLLSLTACAGALPWNPQNNSGIVTISAKYDCEIVGEAFECGQPDLNIIDGKEQGAIEIKFKLNDGTTFNYIGDQILAFRGQELRANVEKAIAEQLGDVAPEVVDQIINSIKGVPQ